MPRDEQGYVQVQDLVHSVLSRPPADREAFLRNACAGNTALFDEVWSRLLQQSVPPATPVDAPFQPGDLLEGRFRIVREVARGGMGIVYEAGDLKLDRRIALKCAKLAHRAYLAGEVRHASEVSHPNVCKIFEIHSVSTPAGEIDFITMEFLDGETLSARLQREPMPEPEARSIARQVCAGLAEAHRNHVIHGDLKTNNIILARSAGGGLRAVITDFGLAHRRDAAPGSKFAGQAGGTPGYMAPELRDGQKATVASDIYALGVVLFELLAGHRPDEHMGPPVSESSTTRTLAAWAPNAHPPPVNPKWDRTVQRCLDPDPNRRFTSADEVLRALGPGHTRRNLLVSAAVLAVASVSAILSYQSATAPASTVRLSVSQFQAGPGTQALAQTITRDAADQLSRLKGNTRVRFIFVPDSARSSATHQLRGSVNQDNTSILLQALLTDTRTGTNLKQWDARYRPNEWRYAPAALAAFTTAAFELPPVTHRTSVSPAAQRDYAQGVAYLKRVSHVDAALVSLGRAVVADPDSPLTHAALAEAQWFKYFATSDKSWLGLATESVRQAELRNLDLAPVHRVSGLLKAQAGWYEQAAADYRRAIQLDPGNSDAYRRLGMAHEMNSEPDKALTAYRRAVELDPSDYRNLQQLGSFYNNLSKYVEAAGYFRRAVELAPDEPEPHRVLGSVYTNLGRFTEAETEFRAAVRIAETPLALHSLAIAMMYQGRDREAIPYLRRALAIGPEQYLRWLNLSTALRRSGATAASQDACRRALRLAEAEMQSNPRDGYVRSILAYLVAQMGDDSRAESEITQASRLSPNDADVRFFATLTFETLKRRDQTIAVLSTSPAGVIADVSRWPDLADLHRDSRFQTLLAAHQTDTGEK